MDAFIDASASLAQRLLPTCLFIILILLIIVLWNLLKFLKRAIKMLDNSEEAISLVSKSLTKIQVPLDGGVKVVEGLNKVREQTGETFTKAVEYIKQNKDNLQEKLDKVLSKVKKEEISVAEPLEEDILGKN